MIRRETRDRACKKTFKDSGIDSLSDCSKGSVLPDKFKPCRKNNSSSSCLVLASKSSDSDRERSKPNDPFVLTSQLFANCGLLSESVNSSMEMDRDPDDIESVVDGVVGNEHVDVRPEEENPNPMGAGPGEPSPGEAMFMRNFMSMMGKMMVREMDHGSDVRLSSSSSTSVAELNRQINALAPHKEGADIVKYIKKLEDDLTDIGCPRARFKTILLQKLQSETAAEYISTLDRAGFSYPELKKLLSDALGSSRLSLGVKLSEFVSENKSVDTLKAYSKIKSLIDSIDMATNDKNDLLLFMATSAFRASRPQSQRSLMDAREIRSFKDLSNVATSLKESEYDKPVARNYAPGSSSSVSHRPSFQCYVCHKYGHRAFECRFRNRSVNESVPNNVSHVKPQGIVCCTCNTPGHKSPDCPNKNQSGQGNKGESRVDNKQIVVKRGSRTYNTSWIAVQNGASHVDGMVNGFPCQIVPDTGAEITIVPAPLVYEDQLRDDFVRVRGWNGEPKLLQTAEVDFDYSGKTFMSVVAVAHEDDLCNRVLFSVPMDGDMASRLLLDAASNAPPRAEEAGHPDDTSGIHSLSEDGAGSVVNPQEACKTSQGSDNIQRSATVAVVTRSMTKSNRSRRKKKFVSDIVEADPITFQSEFERLANIDLGFEKCAAEVDGSTASVSESDFLGSGLGVVSEECKEDELNSHVSLSSNNAICSSDGVPQPVESSGGNGAGDDCISQSTPPSVVINPVVSDNPEFDIPECNDLSSADFLIQEVKSDPSLESIRDLGVRKLNGYSYNDKGVLIHSILDEFNNVCDRIVLPKIKRCKALTLAHDNTAHAGVRGMRRLLNSRFVWPGIHGDIVKFVKSCDVCLRINQSGNKKALMVQRPVLTQPFESVAVDLVGPLPKGKRGSRFMFTYICLSSRWPEALPMRTASAQEAAQCFLQIISCTSIPLKVLSDRGTVFLSKLMDNLSTLLGVHTIQSSPYRPQSNGVVERLHGTLKPMLAKAIDSGIDWVDFLPMALFAIRQVPNRDLGFSPHMLVYGREVIGPLDLLYHGWSEKSLQCMDVESWLLKLNDQLGVIHDMATSKEATANESRAISYNKGKTDRTLNVGDKVLVRIPGLHSSLQASWEGPYCVTDKVSRVTFKVSKGDGHPTRLAHINNLKTYVDRPLNVCAATLVAEEVGIDTNLLESSPLLSSDKCDGFNNKELLDVLYSVSCSFSDKPGLCKSAKCTIVLSEHATPVSQQGRNIPVGIEQAVKKELTKLLDEGIIVKSSALWSSPLVPVRKKDNSVRICVDFRQLNSVTPLVRYWVPSLDEILQKVGQSKCLSTLDLTSGFHQIVMDDASSDLTTFVCPLGKFKYVRMPFGLKNAPAIFQAAVEAVLSPVSDVSCNYVDDVVVFSDSWENHLLDLKRV